MSKYILYSWGANSYGQLGLGSTEDAIRPQAVTEVPSEEISAICGGGGHSLLLLRGGQVLAAGSNSCGQLGISGGNRSQFTPIPLQPIRKIAAGWETSFAITENGELLAWGSNSNGQLGLATSDPCVGTARQVALPGKVSDVAAGARHALAITEDGRCFSWGLGKRGQLGFECSSKNYPSVIPEITSARSCLAGDHHSAVLSSCKCRVFLFGDNRFGQCGLSPNDQPSVRKPASLSFDREIRALRGGWTHVAAVTDDRKVLTWGRNSYAQLGRSCQFSCDPSPRAVEDFVVEDLACGSQHSLAISGGRLFAWGWGEHGICGTGEERDVARPHEVPLEGATLLVGCGAGASFALCKQKED